MVYASDMSSSFIYQPHVRQSDGAIVTPDIVIEHVYASTPDGLDAAPVARLTSVSVLQQTAEADIGAPAMVLVAASFGMLVSVGTILDDVLPVARQAWRYDDIRDSFGDIVLKSWTIRGDTRTVLGSEHLRDLTSPKDAMEHLGNPAGLKPGTMVFLGHTALFGESVLAERVEIALEAAHDTLLYGLDLETIG